MHIRNTNYAQIGFNTVMDGYILYICILHVTYLFYHRSFSFKTIILESCSCAIYVWKIFDVDTIPAFNLIQWVMSTRPAPVH